MNVLKLIAALLVASALVVFGAQNTQSVSFHFLAWDTPAVPILLALSIAMLLGVLLASAVSLPGRYRARRERRALQHRVEPQARPTQHDPGDDAPRPGSEHGAS